MTNPKGPTLSVSMPERMFPGLKHRIQELAEIEGRTDSNMACVLLSEALAARKPPLMGVHSGSSAASYEPPRAVESALNDNPPEVSAEMKAHIQKKNAALKTINLKADPKERREK